MADDNGSVEFSWRDSDSVIIEKVDAVAVYTNPRGDVVIRQDGGMDDDAIIVIPQSRLNELIIALQRELQ